MKRMDLERWRGREVARLLALVETERRYYQEIIGTLPIGVAIVDAELQFLSANRAFHEAFRLSGRASTPSGIKDLFPGDEVSGRIEEVLEEGQSQLNLAFQYVTPDGPRPLRLSIQPFRGWNEDGGTEVLLVVQDLDVRPSDATLEISSAPGRDLLDNVNAIVWERDPASLGFVYVGGRAEEILGYPTAEWTEKPDFDAQRIHPTDRDWVAAFLHSTVSSADSRSCEYRCLTADGRTVWLRDVIRVIRDGQGAPVKLSGITVDINAQKLRDEQVVQAEKMAALGRLASKVTHDCNNLLMILTGYGEDLKESLPADHTARGDIEEILGATERLSRLTTELLSFTRRPALEPKIFSLNSLIESYAPTIRQELETAVSLELRPAKGLDQVNADWDQMGDAVLTLVREARQWMSEGGRLVIETANMELADASSRDTEGLAPGRYAKLSITGTPGIDEEAAARLLEPFSTIRGSGNNLPFIYGVVRSSGGDIRVSVADGSTTLTIYLPSVAQPEVAVSKEPAAVAAAPVTGKETVLVAEDEAGIRTLVAKVLRKQGYTVIEAANGQEALAIAARGPINMLLTDLVMPGISGRELADRLKESHPVLKVLYISGYTDDDLVRYGPLPEGAAFLQKPFSLTALLDKVRAVLES